ncbi:MAG: hypothetical protein A6F71_10755 [Cycloclasticus sp. symbiont of Poecilosclerida sp. M]|nr:MAG: hypothetical protein A6F71_10755 [Cycloclasticus sp. symbiont of Poecilosclerida sp. M]
MLKSYTVCSNGDLRLQDGTNLLEGRVEICMDGVWGSICDNLWDEFDAAVVCRQLGFSDQGMVHTYV